MINEHLVPEQSELIMVLELRPMKYVKLQCSIQP